MTFLPVSCSDEVSYNKVKHGGGACRHDGGKGSRLEVGVDRIPNTKKSIANATPSRPPSVFPLTE